MPESSSQPGGNYKNMFYALGTYGAIGYAPFGVESILDADGAVKKECQPLVDSFRAVSGALPRCRSGRVGPALTGAAPERFRRGGASTGGHRCAATG